MQTPEVLACRSKSEAEVAVIVDERSALAISTTPTSWAWTSRVSRYQWPEAKRGCSH